MCLIALALGEHPRWPLVLAANRDEFHHRPAAPAAWWEDHCEIYGGRDLSAGGTWLGLCKRRRLGAITNYREPPPVSPAGRSRGDLLRRFLTSPEPSREWVTRHALDIQTYAGFNALLLDWSSGVTELSAWYLSNRHPDERMTQLGKGIHGLSNHLLGTRWPKVDRLCRAVSDALSASRDIEACLFEALCDARPIGADELARAQSGATSEVLERTPFIIDERYGTRASTVVMMRDDGLVRFVERSWSLHEGKPRQTAERTMQWHSVAAG